MIPTPSRYSRGCRLLGTDNTIVTPTALPCRCAHFLRAATTHIDGGCPRRSRTVGTVSVRPVVLFISVGLITGCTSGRGSSAAQPHHSLPPNCTHIVSRAGNVPSSLDAALPGDILCFSGDDFANTDLVMTKSGTTQAPIRLVSDGGTLRSAHITANYVTIEGFTITDGDGVLLEGGQITARNNRIHDTQQGGIACQCSDSTIESNTITHVATTGIDITGQRITVDANTISGTVPRDEGDADGIRFYGNGHRITDNTIFDISADDSASAPHPDCFQTLDNDEPPTYDVVISDNTCRNVGAQCLIATGDQRGNGDAPPGRPSITFADNTCANNGAQAINLRRWPNAQILRNKFSGPHYIRAVMISQGSTGATVTGNTTTGDRPTVEIDDSSTPGSNIHANTPA